MTQPATFLTAEWRWLAGLHYPVERALLEPLLPPGTVLDTYKGVAYLSVIAFRFEKTRLLGVRVPFHEDFTEVNLRFYVRRFSGEEWRRGVVFIKEIVPLRAVAVVARRAYNEPYITLPMRHQIDFDAGQVPRAAEYAWRIGPRWNRVFLRTEGARLPVAAGSLEEFLTDLHWGYTRQRDGSVVEYHVEHPRWNVWRAPEAILEGDVAESFGANFAGPLSGPPAASFLVDGSAVSVRKPQRV